MSRFVLVCALVTSLSSAALANRGGPAHFAQAPDDEPHAVSPPRQYVDLQPELGLDRSVRRPPPTEPGWLAPALDRARLRAALVAARAHNLATFHGYEQHGVYPSNVYKESELNVWRDQDGHLCAAATIIKASGQSKLVGQVADQNNFIRLADVRQGPLMDWILTSGFTQAEIVTIQRPFRPVAKVPVPSPTGYVTVDSRRRTVEDARLRAKYQAIEKQLVKDEKQSIELAVDRLIKRPVLAEQLLASTAG